MSRPIVLATGGTGGHIFPALALAQELRTRGHTVHLISNFVPPWMPSELEGAPLSLLPAANVFRGGIVRAFFQSFKLVYAALRAVFLLISLRPRAVVGFGSYAAFAPLLGARLLGLPSALHEQNLVMGQANRVLVRLGVRAALSFAQTERLPARARTRAVIVGHPVRRELVALGKPAYAPPTRRGEYRILVFGGSQGAQIFTRVVPEALARLPHGLQARLQVAQQCAREDMARVLQTYRMARIRVELQDFFADVAQRMARAHVVIARGGAATLSELMALGRPSIVVPLAASRAGEQARNAMMLARRQACVVMAEDELTAARLAARLEHFYAHPATLASMARCARAQSLRHAPAQASERLADFVESLLPATGVRR